MRTLVVWCPDWPVVPLAADHPAGAPVAVLSGGEVLACSPSARAEGVRRGQRRRDAQARCPELVLGEHQPKAEARAFEPVLAAIEELSPGVAPLRPGLCALAVPARFYGGETEAAAVIAERLVELGVWDVRLGVADGVFTAEQAARTAWPQDCVVVPPDGAADFLADLPIEVLDEPGLVGLLRRLGLGTVGRFAGLPPGDVHTRFGAEGRLWHRRARGEEPVPIARRAVPPELDAVLRLEPPVDSAETLAFSLRTTAEQFVARLAEHGLVCTAVRIEIDSDETIISSRRWGHPRWFEATSLVDRLRWQLDSLRQAPDVTSVIPGVEPVEASARPTPVDAVRLIPESVETLGEHAESLFGIAPDDRVERAVARVQGLLGHQGVVAAEVQGGRDPGDRRRLVAWGERAATARPVDAPWPGRIPGPAPATVFSRPPQAHVVGTSGQPVAVSGRGALSCEPARFRAEGTGSWQPVAGWAGPWPVDERWWDETAARRIARFQVVGADGSAWLMSVEDGRWWTEARYD